MSKKKVEGYSEIYKDPSTGVIVNRGSSDRSKYRIAKQQALTSIDHQQDIKTLKEEVEQLSGLKEEMSEIKNLLKQLLDK